jgi:rSAM/selenodomain-associated transferase 2
LGAEAARGETLLFLHADTLLPRTFVQAVRNCLADPSCVGGAFRLHIESSRWAARCVEWGVACRSKLFRLPYGDQAIFVRRPVFEELNGFSALPIMEDYEFVHRLHGRGRLAICDLAVRTSARRWQRIGFVKTTLLNQLMIAAYHCGVAPERLARLYRRGK